jgi:hypothetical protein
MFEPRLLLSSSRRVCSLPIKRTGGRPVNTVMTGHGHSGERLTPSRNALRTYPSDLLHSSEYVPQTPVCFEMMQRRQPFRVFFSFHHHSHPASVLELPRACIRLKSSSAFERSILFLSRANKIRLRTLTVQASKTKRNTISYSVYSSEPFTYRFNLTLLYRFSFTGPLASHIPDLPRTPRTSRAHLGLPSSRHPRAYVPPSWDSFFFSREEDQGVRMTGALTPPSNQPDHTPLQHHRTDKAHLIRKRLQHRTVKKHPC